MEQLSYPMGDLTDVEWKILEPLLPLPCRRGRRRKYSLRAVLNAIFYVIRTGCQWRAVPHDMPPWATVYHYWWGWRRTGLWEQLNGRLREHVRVATGRAASPSAGILDSQSVKTTGVGGLSRVGFLSELRRARTSPGHGKTGPQPGILGYCDTFQEAGGGPCLASAQSISEPR